MKIIHLFRQNKQTKNKPKTGAYKLQISGKLPYSYFKSLGYFWLLLIDDKCNISELVYCVVFFPSFNTFCLKNYYFFFFPIHLFTTRQSARYSQGQVILGLPVQKFLEVNLRSWSDNELSVKVSRRMCVSGDANTVFVSQLLEDGITGLCGFWTTTSYMYYIP